MSRLTTAVLFLALLPAAAAAGAKPTHPWQEGELISRKTVPTRHGGLQHKYIYRLRSANATYVVASKEPLQVALGVPVKFATVRRHLVIQDSDGRECKLSKVTANRTAAGFWL